MIYTIQLASDLSIFYEEIARICNKTTEEVIEDTLLKAADILSR